MIDLHGNVALVTGASRGVGKGVALATGKLLDLSNSASPQLIGHAVAALTADPHIMQRSGQVLGQQH